MTDSSGNTSEFSNAVAERFATTTTVSPSPAATTYGQSVTFTATVSSPGTPTGTVTFQDDGTTIGTGTLSSGTATFTTSALAAGTHTISAVYGGDSNDYGSTSSAVTETVTPAALTITANDQSKVYGSSLPALTASYSGFVNGDTSASLTTVPTLTTTATAASPVGSYGIAVSGAVDANYSITYAGGTLTVTPATLSVTANNASKVYGTSNPALSDTITGYVNGDGSSVVSGSASLTTTAVAGSGVGGYTITAAAGSLSASNYSFSFVNGTLMVTPATLTVRTNDASKVYGAANPAFSDTITGYVNGDTSAVLSGTAGLTTTATSGSGVGSYTITAAAGSLSAGNYSFSFVNGASTVTRAALTITANGQNKVYGSSLPALTASYSGFVNGDTSASLTTAPTLTTTATAASPVGSYGIAVSGAVDANYSISYVGGTLMVVPATLTVTANDASKVYGTSNAALSDTITGYVNGDTQRRGQRQRQPDHDGGCRQRRRRLRDHRRGGQPQCQQLQLQLRQRYADGDPGHADRDGQRRQQGLRRRQPGV